MCCCVALWVVQPNVFNSISSLLLCLQNLDTWHYLLAPKQSSSSATTKSSIMLYFWYLVVLLCTLICVILWRCKEWSRHARAGPWQHSHSEREQAMITLQEMAVLIAYMVQKWPCWFLEIRKSDFLSRANFLSIFML